MHTMTIGGKPVDSTNTYDVVNPATGAVAAQAPDCSIDQLDQAVAAAQGALDEWSSDESARRDAMRQLGAAIMEHTDELVAALQLETGKPTALAGAEPYMCNMWLSHFAEMELPREVIQDDESAFVEMVHRPVGVVGAIAPWNFPLVLSMWKIAPALRAGNTVVVKPSPFTPLAALVMGRIMGEVLPPGVVNTLSGGDQLGASVVQHPGVHKVSFTGSVEGGRNVGVAAMQNLKPVTLELGGNDAAIILDDADPATVAQELMTMAFLNAGQACALPKRVYVPAARHDEFVGALAAVAEGMAIGDPAAEGTTMGPLSTRPQFERVCGLVDDAASRGATFVTGGKRGAGDGFFFEPTIVTGLAEGARLVDEEQFGPTLPVMSYDTVDEAITRANSTHFGLAGSVWSGDPERAAALAPRVEAGTVFVNTHGGTYPHVPFGGHKQSGIGVENGLPGLLGFTKPQVVNRAR